MSGILWKCLSITVSAALRPKPMNGSILCCWRLWFGDVDGVDGVDGVNGVDGVEVLKRLWSDMSSNTLILV